MGLSPYFMECFSYKFDSPYMALSVLVSVSPFLLMKTKVYSILSVLSIIAMCMTYQAASGIYPMMVLFIFFMNWNKGESIRKGIHFVTKSAFAYMIAMIIFYVFVMNFIDGYVNGNILPIEHLIDGCYHNFYQYYANIYYDFKLVWIFLVIVIVVGFLWRSN